MPLPRVRVRIPHPSEPDALQLDEWLDEDAAAIFAGTHFPYVIEILDQAGQVVNDCLNLIAGPGHEGLYAQPDDIRDQWLAYYAADHWTPECGVEPGTLIRHEGRHHWVLAFEQVDQEHGYIGSNTGFLLCHPASPGPLRVLWVADVSPVLELTAPKCSTLGCRAWATHTLETDNPDPVPYEPEREREPICEPCGSEYVRTNRIKRLNGTLTEGTA